jgi:hypothetical protein
MKVRSRRLLEILTVVSAALIVMLIFPRNDRSLAAEETVSREFTVEFTDISVEETGRIFMSREKTAAMRKDGSKAERVVSWRTDGSGMNKIKEYENLTIWDRQRDRIFFLYPMVESKSTMALNEPTIRNPRPTPPACVDQEAPLNESTVSADEIAGFPVVRLEANFEHNAGPRNVVTQWRAPGLDCMPLRTISTLVDVDGKVKSRKTVEAISVRLGEPDPTMFEVDSSYTERIPSEIYRMESERQGKEVCAECGTEQFLDNADQRYHQKKGGQ